MAQASIETTLELWAGSLRRAKERLRPLFRSKATVASAEAFVDGLLGSEPRKTGGRKRRATKALGANRICSIATGGMRTRYGMWCAIMGWRRWRTTKPCW
jgi:hypothetical protein